MSNSIEVQVARSLPVTPDAQESEDVVDVSYSELASKNGGLPACIDDVPALDRTDLPIAVLDRYPCVFESRGIVHGKLGPRHRDVLECAHTLGGCVVEEDLVEAFSFHVHRGTRIAEVSE